MFDLSDKNRKVYCQSAIVMLKLIIEIKIHGKDFCKKDTVIRDNTKIS
jgi:hypothetical protein